MIANHNVMKSIVKIVLIACLSITALATERIGRLGIGATNHVQSDIPSLSIKLQRSKSFSYSAFFGINTSDTGGWNAGLKFYKNIFEEPQLTFYGFGLGALVSKKINSSSDQSGFVFDTGFGAEFSFAGLESIGLSIDFGVSLYKLDQFAIKTIGDNFVIGSFHFYL